MIYNNVLVVLNYNDARTTTKYIKHIKRFSAIQKIIVVDNCSSDNSYAQLLPLVSDKIDVIKSKKNGGYAYGNNYGIRYAIEKYNPKICFVSNPDVLFDNITIIKMQNYLEKNNDVAIVAPVVNQGYNVWNLPQFMGVIESLFLLWHNIHKLLIKEKILHSSDEAVKVGSVEGSFFAISTMAYKLIDGFDERTFLYYEENIIAKKINNHGLDIIALKNCRYDHFHSTSIHKEYGTKAKTFLLLYPSVSLYLNEYLKVKTWQNRVFHFAFKLAYIERCMYDWIYHWKATHGNTRRTVIK